MPDAAIDPFQGTVPYYLKFRPGLPAAVVDHLARRFGLDPTTSRVLDLGTGTGQAAMAMIPVARAVVAVDAAAEMIEAAREEASLQGIDANTISWRVGDAASYELDAPFDLVTVVRAFHWMDQPLVLDRMTRWLCPGGGVALMGDSSLWNGTADWQRTTKEVIQRFLGSSRRAGAGYFRERSREPYTVMLKRAGFVDVASHQFDVERAWTFESLLGYLYSTTFAARRLFGDRVEDFETTLHAALGKPDPGTEFLEFVPFSVEAGRTRRRTSRARTRPHATFLDFGGSMCAVVAQIVRVVRASLEPGDLVDRPWPGLARWAHTGCKVVQWPKGWIFARTFTGPARSNVRVSSAVCVH